jgi:hypothetical protein
MPATALQRHFTDNSKQIFPEVKMRDLVPNPILLILLQQKKVD